MTFSVWLGMGMFQSHCWGISLVGHYIIEAIMSFSHTQTRKKTHHHKKKKKGNVNLKKKTVTEKGKDIIWFCLCFCGFVPSFLRTFTGNVYWMLVSNRVRRNKMGSNKKSEPDAMLSMHHVSSSS